MLLLTVSLLFLLWSQNPLFGILGLILVFINAAIILVSLNVNFLALIYVIIYVGAICVLFLFVIMLLNLRHFDIKGKNMKFLPFILAYLLFLLAYLFVVRLDLQSILFLATIYSEIFSVPEITLVTGHLIERPILFLVLILLLLLAIISPIVIASKRVITEKKQDLFYAQARALTSNINTWFG
jgi:NADH-quinone oxidoreductase subunit J